MTRTVFLLFVLFVALLVAGVFLLQSKGEEDIRASLALAEAMGGDTTGYAHADEVRDLVFPDDYGPHPGFKTEWWYYTGNLDTEQGRHFGYEFTISKGIVIPTERSERRNLARSVLQDL